MAEPFVTAASPSIPKVLEGEPHPNYPNEPLPRLDYSIDDFIDVGHDFVVSFTSQKGENLCKQQRLQQLLSFALTGRQEVDGTHCRVYVDALRATDTLLPNRVSVYRSYSSLIGYSTDLPYAKPITIYPLPELARYSLVEDNHLTYPICRPDRKTIFVPLCDIPNTGLAAVDTNNSIRLFFPSLLKNDAPRPPTLDAHTLKSIYSNAIIPAVLNYHQKCKVHNDSSGLHVDSHDSPINIPPHALPELGQEILHRLESDCGLPGAFYMHECSGTWGQDLHGTTDPDHTQKSLKTLLANFKEDVALRPTFFINVASDFIAERSVLNWKQNAHPHILAHILNISTSDACELMSMPGHFCVDSSSQLDDIAGFRYRPTQDIENSTGIAYIQAYCTDKNAMYQHYEGHHFRAYDPSELVPGSSERIVNDTFNIYSTFDECATHETPAAARLELKVRIDLAHNLLIDTWPDNLLNLTIVRFHAFTWWYFNFLRTFCLHHAISLLCQCKDPMVRSGCPSLSLGAMLVWMLNSTILSLSCTTPAQRILAEICSLQIPLTNNTGELQWRSTTIGRGLYFLSAIICQDHEIKLPENRANHIDPHAVANVYKVESLSLIQQQFRTSAILPDQAMTHPGELPLRGHSMGLLELLQRDETDHGPDFGLDALNIPLPPRWDPDVADFRHSDENTSLDANRLMSKIWARFFIDVMSQAPNPKRTSDIPYLVKRESRQGMWSEDDFKTLNLHNVFHLVHARRLSPESWRALQFDRYFPENPGATFPEQIKRMPYYIAWKQILNLITTGSPLTKATIRAAVEREFNKLKWVPYSESDRVWTTRSRKKAGWKHFPETCSNRSAISLAINPHTTRDDYSVQVGIKTKINEGQGLKEEVECRLPMEALTLFSDDLSSTA